MPNNETENDASDGREFAAAIFDGAARIANDLAKLIPDLTAKTALGIGAALAATVGALVRRVGLTGAEDTINELERRKSEGVILANDIAQDDSSIGNAVSEFYKTETES